MVESKQILLAFQIRSAAIRARMACLHRAITSVSIINWKGGQSELIPGDWRAERVVVAVYDLDDTAAVPL